jgi:hypothetical protein
MRIWADTGSCEHGKVHKRCGIYSVPERDLAFGEGTCPLDSAAETNLVISKAMHLGPTALCWKPQSEYSDTGFKTRVSWSAETANTFHPTAAQTELRN